MFFFYRSNHNITDTVQVSRSVFHRHDHVRFSQSHIILLFTEKGLCFMTVTEYEHI